MENAAEALKIAFAIMLLVMALTLSISSFSEANRAVKAITTIRDRETQYTYVEPSKDFSRTVGIETVVSTIYRTSQENMEIYFFKQDGKTPITLYNDVDDFGNIIGEVSCINLANESFADQNAAKDYFEIILGGKRVLDTKSEQVKKQYEKILYYEDGLYQEFKDKKFKELFGEYDQGKGTTQIKKRVITYILQP